MINIGQIVLDNFRKNFEITENDIGSDAVLKKSMMKFVTRTYDIKDYGHLCVMNMEGMLGLMKMETVILVPFDKDVPLVDFDYISAMGKETYIAEFYRYMLKEYPEEYVSELAKCPEQVCRHVKYFIWCAYLLDVAVLHDDDPVTKCHGFSLVMGYVDECRVDLLT